jgi:alkylation response protein AidB-like acyl-CoA dehydrogenase
MDGPSTAGVGLDLLADGDPVRDDVRAALAAWRLETLAATQESATGYPEPIWQAFREAVGPRLGDPQVVRVALEEVGYARCPLPVHGGLVQPLAAAPLLGDAAGLVRTHLLSGGRFEFVMHGSSGLPGAENVSVKAEQVEGRWRISGSARHLRYADSAGYLLVPARAGRGRLLLALVPSGAQGVRLEVHPTLTGDRLTDVTFDDVDLDSVAVLAGDSAGDRRGVDAMDAAQDLGTLAVAAELVGLSARLVAMATERVKSRQAYGAPLAALQGVQQRGADLYLNLQAARDAVAEAAAALKAEDGPLSSPRVLATIAGAKATAAESALAVAAGAHQLCGGWGLLDAAGLHHYTRAIKAAEAQLGSPRYHRSAIAEYLKV